MCIRDSGLTVSLARELGPKGIRVNAVAPGITETDMMKAVPKEVIEPMIERIPLRRLGQPEDIANAFVFLASDEASYICLLYTSLEKLDRTVDEIRRRFGYFSIQRAAMYQDKVLSHLDAGTHTVHPHSYFHG